MIPFRKKASASRILIAVALCFALLPAATAMTNFYTNTSLIQGSNGGSTFFTHFNRSNFTYVEINLTWQLTGDNATGAANAGPKWYPDSTASGNGNEDIYFEWHTANLNWSVKEEPTFPTLFSDQLFNNITVTYRVNFTADNMSACIAGVCSAKVSFVDNLLNFTSIAWGNNGSKMNVTRVSVDVLDSEWYNLSSGGGGGAGSSYNGTYPLLNASETGIWSGNSSMNRSDLYDKLIRDQQLSGNVSYSLNGNLWVPWYGTSSSCLVSDLKSGSSCDIDMTVDATHHCMVNDELSQVCIQISMGINESLMEQAYSTIVTTRSTYGTLPAWKTWRNGSSIVVCHVTNTNCDTASDATARSIISLYNAANNSAFSTGNRTKYLTLANQMAADMLRYEVVQSCKPSHLGHGQICYWLAGGSDVRASGLSASYFTYTGYFPDAQIAFAQAYAMTGNLTYAAVAGNLSLNYLQAAYPNAFNYSTSGLRAPPGKAFHWTNTSTAPAPVCDDTCSPEQWDAFDASRALGYCEANYWMRRSGINNTAQETYCRNLGNRHFNSTSSSPLQLYPNGTNSASYQSSYHAQGQGALHQMGGHNQSLFQPTIDEALSHYTAGTKTWDSEACFGVYTKAYAIRALGEGIGRNLNSWPDNITQVGGGGSPSIAMSNVSFFQSTIRANTDPICRANATYSGSEANITFAYEWKVNGTTVSSGSTVATPGPLVNVSTLSNSYLARNASLSCIVSATDGFQTSSEMNATVTVLGALQVLQTAILTSNNYLLNCTYTATDRENDTVTAETYKYFVNGTLNSTSQTINVSTFATNSTVICQVNINDTDGNATPLNTSTYTVGDSQAPTISNVTIPAVGSITDVLQITATVTDDRALSQGTPVVQFKDPNNQIQGNYTMTNISPTHWYLNFTFSIVGTYTNFKISARDASTNLATYSPSDTLAITLPGNSPPGGGGGGAQNTPAPSTNACGFSIVQPTTAAFNPLCPTGLKSSSFSVVLRNDLGTAQDYQATIPNSDCVISEPSFTIQPKATKTLTVTSCSCPATGDVIKADLIIKNAECGQTLPISLYSNFFTRLIKNNTQILLLSAGIAGSIVLFGLLIFLVKRT